MSKIKTQRQGAVLTVTLNRPEAHNAFDHEMVVALRDTFRGVATADPKDRPHVVLLQAEGKTFCAGGDLEDMRRLGSADFAENLAAALELGDMFRAIRLCPAPVIVRVQGDAYGGGVGLVCSCDVVVASESARFALTEARLGLVAGVISPMIVGKLGPGRARMLTVTGDRIDAEEAHRLGLVDKLVGIYDLDSTVQLTLSSVLKCGPQALGKVKELIEGVESRNFEENREYTARMIAEARTSPEAQAALQAFFAKQPAPWVADTDDGKK